MIKERKRMCSCNNSSGHHDAAQGNGCGCHSPETKMARFLQPCLLLLLAQKSSHGYELIEAVSQFGFEDGAPDPASVYKHLRKMEEDGLVKSAWDTRKSGAARRSYQVTQEGKDYLRAWSVVIQKNKTALERFLLLYEQIAVPQRTQRKTIKHR
jgi:poly-beta-hydroxybutyrate-responsive repressor